MTKDSESLAENAKAFLDAMPLEDQIALGKHVEKRAYKKGLLHGALTVLITAPIAQWLGWNLAAWISNI